jgi:polar amino acid transport system substrate-binding protein
MKAITLVLAVVLVVAGCSTDPGTVGNQNPAAVQPLPAGATEVTSLDEPSVDTSCGNPKESFRPPGPPATLSSATTVSEIRDRGRLIVGVDQNTYGFAFRDSKSGEIQGFALDIARDIANAIFGAAAVASDPTKIQLRVLNSDQRIEAVKKEEVDLVVHSMTTNCERWQDVDFSTVFFEANQRVLVRSDVADQYEGVQSLAGKKVCATKSSTSLARIVNEEVTPRPVGMQVSGWTDCLVMMQQYQVDAISTDDTILAGLVAQDPFVRMVGNPIAQEPYAIAMPKHHEDFVRFVNAVLEEIKTNGTWTAHYDKWLRPLLLGPAPAPPVAEYRG